MLHSSLARGALLGLVLACSLASARAEELRGAWSGYYACAQGRTAFTLTLDATGHGTLEFGPHPENPNIPAGAYEVEVSVDDATVSIDAGEWITRPAGYVTVEMDGVLSGDQRSMTGSVDNASCSTFHLSRLDSGEGEAQPTPPKQKADGDTKPDTGPVIPPEEPPAPAPDVDPPAVVPAPPPDTTPAPPSPPPVAPGDRVAIPGIEWPDSILRLIDVAGFRIVLDLEGEPCTDPRFSIEIDAPAILPFVQQNMAGRMSGAYNPYETTGSCGLGSWDMKVDPIPVFYLGRQVGTVEEFIHPAVSGQPTAYTGSFDLPLSDDPAIAAEQAILGRYWTALLNAGSSDPLYQAGDNAWLPVDDRQSLLSSPYASRQAAEVVILVADRLAVLQNPCSAPWLIVTEDVTRLRQAAELGSPLAACRLAAMLEWSIGLDVEHVARGRIALSVVPFADQSDRVEGYLEATCHRVSAFRQRYLSGMFHTMALDAARNEFEAAAAYLDSNPGQPCRRFAALGSQLKLSDADGRDTRIEGGGLPGTGLGDPPKMPKNDLFDLANDFGVGYAAGYATEVVNCDLSLASDEMEVIQLLALNGVVLAGGGTDFAGRYVIESIAETGAGFIAGLAAGRSLGCSEPQASAAGAALVDLVDQARSEGEAFGRPFLNACEANSSVFGAKGCECAAQVGLVVLPDIYARPYDDHLLEEIGRQNPTLYLNMLSMCAIGQFAN